MGPLSPVYLLNLGADAAIDPGTGPTYFVVDVEPL